MFASSLTRVRIPSWSRKSKKVVFLFFIYLLAAEGVKTELSVNSCILFVIATSETVPGEESTVESRNKNMLWSAIRVFIQRDLFSLGRFLILLSDSTVFGFYLARNFTVALVKAAGTGRPGWRIHLVSVSLAQSLIDE